VGEWRGDRKRAREGWREGETGGIDNYEYLLAIYFI